MMLVLQVVHRVITRHLLGQAGGNVEGADEADSGAVTLIQRFGSAANLPFTFTAWSWTVCTGAALTGSRSSLKFPGQLTKHCSRCCTRSSPA